MVSSEPGFHFPTEIHLARNPLAEAWLELQWRTTPQAPSPLPLPFAPPDEAADTHYPLALGAFYQGIKREYPVQEPLAAAQFPDTIFPHTVRHRFRVAADRWPVLQLGPGIATVNFIKPYTWEQFRVQAIFLRKHLWQAYSGVTIYPIAIVLRYRNVFSVDHRNDNVLNFLATRLNLKIEGPTHIPGPTGESRHPAEAGLNLSYSLRRPEAIGALRLATALETKTGQADRPILLADLEVHARNDSAAPLLKPNLFATWLDQAHTVIHEWFFALIDGPLRQEYSGD